jgi:hypothetical protein
VRYIVTLPAGIRPQGTLYESEDEGCIEFQVEANTIKEARDKFAKRLRWILYGSEKDCLR